VDKIDIKSMNNVKKCVFLRNTIFIIYNTVLKKCFLRNVEKGIFTENLVIFNEVDTLKHIFIMHTHVLSR